MSDIEGIILTASWLVMVSVIFLCSYSFWRVRVLKEKLSTADAPTAGETSLPVASRP